MTSGTPMIIEQIKAQLSRLVPVRKVHDLTEEGPFVEREMALVKVTGKGEAPGSKHCGWPTSSAPASSTRQSRVLCSRSPASAEKLNAFIALMEPLGLAEVSRTGAVAIARGAGRF